MANLKTVLIRLLAAAGLLFAGSVAVAPAAFAACPAPFLTVSPISGAPGSAVTVNGGGFCANGSDTQGSEPVQFTFLQNGVAVNIGSGVSGSDGSFPPNSTLDVPNGAAAGPGQFRVTGPIEPDGTQHVAGFNFTVTGATATTAVTTATTTVSTASTASTATTASTTSSTEVTTTTIEGTVVPAGGTTSTTVAAKPAKHGGGVALALGILLGVLVVLAAVAASLGSAGRLRRRRTVVTEDAAPAAGAAGGATAASEAPLPAEDGEPTTPFSPFATGPDDEGPPPSDADGDGAGDGEGAGDGPGDEDDAT